MPFNVDAPMVQTQEPRRYPTPNWSKPAEVRECWLPGEPAVGWLVIQDDEALAWLSSVGPDRPAAYAVREIVQDSLEQSLVQNMDVRSAWNRACSIAMFRWPEYMDLDKLAKRLSEQWS